MYVLLPGMDNQNALEHSKKVSGKARMKSKLIISGDIFSSLSPPFSSFPSLCFSFWSNVLLHPRMLRKKWIPIKTVLC